MTTAMERELRDVTERVREAQRTLIGELGNASARQSTMHMLIRDIIDVALSEDDLETRERELLKAIDHAHESLGTIIQGLAADRAAHPDAPRPRVSA